jgi:hypothetical protein
MAVLQYSVSRVTHWSGMTAGWEGLSVPVLDRAISGLRRSAVTGTIEGAPDRASRVSFIQETARRRTFVIISHPDARKTTITEKRLLFGGAIELAGTVKGRESLRPFTSDWMEMEKQRGISVTSSGRHLPRATAS